MNDKEKNLIETIVIVYNQKERAYEIDKENVMIFRIKDFKAL